MTTLTSAAPAATSIADVRRLLDHLPGPDEVAREQVAVRETKLTKPQGSLGRLEALAGWLAAWQGRCPPTVMRPSARVFAGNHGVTARGVSAYPAEVTAQMVANFTAGGAAVNQLCRTFGVELTVDALDLDRPTLDMCDHPAMTEEEFAAAFSRGFAAVDEHIDILALGEMGIGNTTSAAALACALFGGRAGEWTGPGTGVAGSELDRKTAVVEAAVGVHGKAAIDPLDLLRRLGGRELVAIAGAVVAARRARVPVLLDGFICTAAVAPLFAHDPDTIAHCLAAHQSAEPGHKRLLQILGLTPAILSLDMRLGEASGAVLAIPVLQAAVACHTGMATFDEAKVSGRDRRLEANTNER